MKTNTNISPKEMVAWFRDKAAEFNRIADTVESTFSSANGMAAPQRAAQSNPDVTLDQIKKVVDKKNSRAGTIAAELNTTRERVQAMIDQHPESFEKFGKGWIKVKK